MPDPRPDGFWTDVGLAIVLTLGLIVAAILAGLGTWIRALVGA